MTLRRLAIGLALVGIAAACSAVGGASSAVSRVELTVYAAASLRGAVAAAATAYEMATPGITLTIATDASSTLRTQIEQGAPADVFLSADEQNPATLVDAGRTDGPAVAFAGNVLVVIVPTANPAGIDAPADLARPGVKIIGAGADVPISAYAATALARLESQPGYPAGFAAAYGANVVSKEENVKAVVAKVELGEGDAAIVYSTDAEASLKVKRVEIPAAANVVATYAGVVLKSSAHTAAAHAFLTWLAGPDGQVVLAGFGFWPPP